MRIVIRPEWTDPDRWEIVTNGEATEFHVASEKTAARVLEIEGNSMSEPTRPEMPADLVAAVEALRGPGGRRHKMPPGECAFCDREREAGSSFHPSHDATDHCQSGKHDHCTCDSCF